MQDPKHRHGDAPEAPDARGAPNVGSPRPALNRGVFLAVVGIFVASGAAGLIYEIVWFRLLTYLFGATLLAVSTVLTSFMSGLALGSWALGRRADTMRRPLRFYAILELGIAASALLMPWALQAIEAASRATFHDLSFPMRSLARLVCNLLALALPTTLMGATLPVMSRFIARRKEALGFEVGGLYAANTAGAVAGTFLAGFVLIETLGMAGTQFFAAGLNLLAAALAWGIDLRFESRSEAASGTPGGPPASTSADAAGAASKPVQPASAARPPYAVLVTYAISGAVAMSFQVAWSRGLLFCAEGTTYTLSAMLTVFLAGLALGSAIMTRLADRHPAPRRLYALLLMAIGASGGLSGLLLFHVAPWWAPIDTSKIGDHQSLLFLMITANRVARIIIVMGLPTLLMGMAFPVAARLCVTDLARVSGDVGRLYAFNTVGSIIGSAASGFLLIPALGLSRSILFLACVSIACATWLFLTDRTLRAGSRAGIAGLAVGLSLLLGLYLGVRPLTFAPYLQEDLPYEVLAIREGPLDTVTVTQNILGTRKITVDNIPVAGTDRVMLTDQKSLAHFPALMLPSPRSVLTVGFGSGGASHSYTLYEELTKVHCVEISSTILTPSIQRLLVDSNHGLIDRLPQLPQYAIQRDDARSYLRFTRERYDSIAVDCTDLRYKANANLYDLEFFELCRSRLTNEGMVVVWMPVGDLTPELFRTALRTFARVFPGTMHVWFCNNGLVHYCLLAGYVKQPMIDYRTVVARASRPAIAADLGEILMQDPDRFLGCYVTGGKPLDDYLFNANEAAGIARDQLPVNSENNPLIEFEAPRLRVTSTIAWENLQNLYAHRQSVLEIIDPATIPAENARRIARFEQAAPVIAKGLEVINDESGDHPAEAAPYFAKARAIAPDDPVLDDLESFGFQKQMLGLPDNRENRELTLGLADAHFTLATKPIPGLPNASERSRLHYGQAMAYYRRAVELINPMPQPGRPLSEPERAALKALVQSVRCLAGLGKTRDAATMLERVAREFPGQPELLKAEAELRGAPTPATQGNSPAQ